MLCFVFWRTLGAAENCLCLPAMSMLQRHLGSSGVVYPHPQHRSSSQIPSFWLSKWCSCCLSRQLGAVENPSLLHHVQQRTITPSFAPAFSPSCCPGVLGHSLGIPQQSQSLLESREMLCAMQPFLPHEQQVRSGLALQHAPH